MIKRIFSTIVLWTLLISVIYFFKAPGFAVLMLILALGSGYEACALLERSGAKPSFAVYSAASVLLFCSVFFFGSVSAGIVGPVMCAVFALFALWLLRFPYSDAALKTLLSTMLLFIFIPGMLCLYAVIGYLNYSGGIDEAASMRLLPYGGIIIAVWAIAAAKFSDVGGYLFGMFFGRHKMSPTISPKKTWEGAVGGLIVSSGISAAIAWGFSEQTPAFFTPVFAAAAALPIAVLAICSDLLESVLKRRAGIKDSGRTIPGIGGALDLVDSMLLPAPFVILIIAFFE